MQSLVVGVGVVGGAVNICVGHVVGVHVAPISVGTSVGGGVVGDGVGSNVGARVAVMEIFVGAAVKICLVYKLTDM